MARLSVIKNIKKIDNRILSMLSFTLTLARFVRLEFTFRARIRRQLISAIAVLISVPPDS